MPTAFLRGCMNEGSAMRRSPSTPSGWAGMASPEMIHSMLRWETWRLFFAYHHQRIIAERLKLGACVRERTIPPRNFNFARTHTCAVAPARVILPTTCNYLSPDWWWRGQACFSRLCAKAGRHLCTPPPPPLCKTRRRPRLKKHDYGQSEEGCSSPTKATRTREKREEGEVEVWQPRATLSRGRPAGLEPWRHTRFLFRRAKVKVFLFAVQGSPTRRKTPTKATRRARADQEGAWVRPVVPSQTSATPSASRHPHADNRAEL